MTTSERNSDEVQYIVVPRTTQRDASSSSARLQELLRLAPSRDVTIVKVVGSAEQPRRLVVRGSPERIAELRSAFEPELLFEEDVYLKQP